MTSATPPLPLTAPLERFLRAHALLALDEFVAALPGGAVFVRVDERGGSDELAPWAFPQRDVPLPGDDGAFVDIALTSMSAEATATGPVQPPLPRPPAREHASVIVVPREGGPLGRAAACAVRVTERSISRHHADLLVDGDAWSIVDRDSDNGTGVNGMALQAGAPHRLRSGDVVQLGDVVLLFLDGVGFHTHLPALAGA